jgi:hypothetical protein
MQLILRDRISIQADQATVMGILRKPELWPSFVDKIESLTYVNFVYSGKIRMGSKRSNFIGRLIESTDNGRVELEVQFIDEGKSNTVMASIVYQTTAAGQMTEVREQIHYLSQINFFIWLLLKIIMVFGRPVEASNLENLKALIEK